MPGAESAAVVELGACPGGGGAGVGQLRRAVVCDRLGNRVRVAPVGTADRCRHWVDDVLMTIFFFGIGLELEYELTRGLLAHSRRALVPVFAAV